MVVLLELSPISTEELSDHQVLGHLPDQDPYPLIAQFGRAAKVQVVPNFVHLRMI